MSLRPQLGHSYSYHELMEAYRERIIRDALRRRHGEIAQAARLLRMSRNLLYYWIKKLGIAETVDGRGH